MLHAVRKVVQLLVQNSQGRLHRVESRMLSSLAVQIALNHAVQKNRFKLYQFLKATHSGGFYLKGEHDTPLILQHKILNRSSQ